MKLRAIFEKIRLALMRLRLGRQKNALHYMSNGEALPKPYSKEEEEEKIELLLGGKRSV